MTDMNAIDWTAYALMAIGALNWGSVGFFDYNIVHELFTLWGGVFAERVIYGVVGISGIYALVRIPKIV